MKKYLFLGSKQFDFKDDNKENIKIAKIFLIDTLPLTKPRKPKKGYHGLVTSEISIPYDMFPKTEQLVPMKHYNFDVDFVIDGKKATVVINDFDTTPVDTKSITKQ